METDKLHILCRKKIKTILSLNVSIHYAVFVTMAWKLVSGRKVNIPKFIMKSELLVDSIPRSNIVP